MFICKLRSFELYLSRRHSYICASCAENITFTSADLCYFHRQFIEQKKVKVDHEDNVFNCRNIRTSFFSGKSQVE